MTWREDEDAERKAWEELTDEEKHYRYVDMSLRQLGWKDGIKGFNKWMEEWDAKRDDQKRRGLTTEECWLEDWNLRNGFESPFKC